MQNTRYSRRILKKLKFSRQISKKTPQISDFMKYIQCEPSYSMRTDKLRVAFRNFAKTPKT